MVEYSATVMNFSSLQTITYGGKKVKIASLLNLIPGHNHLWTFPIGINFEVSERGYTQVIVESIKDLILLNQKLLNLAGFSGPPFFKEGKGEKFSLSWVPGLAYDSKTGQVVYVAYSDQSQKKEEVLVSQEDLKKANIEQFSFNLEDKS